MRNNGEGHRNKHFSSQENDVLQQFDQGFKGTIINRALLSLHGWSLKITLTDYTVLLLNKIILNSPEPLKVVFTRFAKDLFL